MCVKFLLFPHFLYFLLFNHDYDIHIDFTSIAPSNTATDKVSHYRESSLNRIKNRQPGHIFHQF